MKKANIHYQAERLAEVFGDLVRAYQFRDRNEICCHGVTVSQCYTLEALDRQGPMTMSELGNFLFLDISTVSRVIDQLEDAGHVVRIEDADDGRITRVQLTRKGQGIQARIEKSLRDDYKCILEVIPTRSRDDVVRAVTLLLEGFTSRGCCLERRQSGKAAA